VRPVNLIPKEQRRAAPGAGGSREQLITYSFLGVLAVAFVVVLAAVLTTNQINDRKDKVTKLEKQAAESERAAQALRPYGSFARLQQTRVDTIRSLAESRFNWERVMRALSRTIPSDVWLVGFKGTTSPIVELESDAGGGGTSALRNKTTSPAVELAGCTYSHSSVARMMVRMRNIDGVTEVALGKSERPESESSQQTAQASPEGGGASSSDDCRTRPSITKFDILVVLGGAGSAPAAAGATAATTATPTSAAQAQQSASGATGAAATTTTGAAK
jgi:Tfp pilus assembly protein PilN